MRRRLQIKKRKQIAKQMAKQTRPAKRVQPKASKKSTGTWGRNYYIPGFGRVNFGDPVTGEQLEA